MNYLKSQKTTIFCIVLLLVFAYFKYTQTTKILPSSIITNTTSTQNNLDIVGKDIQLKKYSDLPNYAQHTIDFLKANNFTHSETGYVGGRYFTNYEKVLPWVSETYYKEWDVHPKVKGVNRGTERLVTGEKGEIYFTNTHYGNSGSPAFYLIQY